MMFPSTIHSVMRHNGNSLGETPKTVKTFGWERRLQITISWNKRCHELSNARTTCVRSLAANLFGSGQILGCVGAERFCTYKISTVATFPNICKPSRSEFEVALF